MDFARRYEIALSIQPMKLWFEEERRKAPKKYKELTRKPGIVVEDAQRPTAEEVKMNSRSRSAVLHVLRRETGTRMQDLEEVAERALHWEPHEQLPDVIGLNST